MMLYVMWIAMAYLLGSVPFGLVVGKLVCGVDPREAGSRNIGATNVARLCGTKWGVATLTLDILKGLAPVAGAMTFSCHWLLLSLVVLAAYGGHMYSCFLGLKGGKGVATTIGAFLPVTPLPILLAVACCVAMIALTGYVSVGSLVLALTLPIWMAVFCQWGFVPLGLVTMLLIFWKHKENIVRLAKGEENPWRKGTN